jgi:hypothetical protein
LVAQSVNICYNDTEKLIIRIVHDMILFEDLILNNAFDDEEEEDTEEGEEGDADIDDELLGELDDEVLEEDELLPGEIDPLMKADESGFGEISEHDDPEKETSSLEDDEEEEDMDYDSFDDKDEM